MATFGLDKVNADAAAAAAAAASAAAFFTNAVKEAQAHGLEFTEEEFHAFIAALIDCCRERGAVGYTDRGDAGGTIRLGPASTSKNPS